MNWPLRRALPLSLSLVLTACAGIPRPQAPQQPAIKLPTTATAPAVITPPVSELAAPVSADVWARLRSSFAMADCDADPAVLAQARHDTRYPDHFESQLHAVLPRLVYVQQIASHYDVAGEFVLLPWVESHYQPIPARGHRPAGMWQLMPHTAEVMGLRVSHDYDGRLDMPAATDAVMKLLGQYHDQFHDWRLTDYAYNAGEYAVRNIVRKHGMPADTSAIPDLPVRKVTRDHLTKLLAIACVIRDPARFNVSLPNLPDDQHLVQVKISHSMPIAHAADRSGISPRALKQLNAAFRTNKIDAAAASYLILPADHARQFRNTQRAQQSNVDTHLPEGHADDVTMTRTPRTEPVRTHTVKPGESLWQIARDNSIDVSQLQSWNGLHGQMLKPGQVLQISNTD